MTWEQMKQAAQRWGFIVEDWDGFVQFIKKDSAGEFDMVSRRYRKSLEKNKQQAATWLADHGVLTF